MKTKYWVVVLICVVGVSALALADPVTVSAGETVIFNFDIVGAFPPGPYGDVYVETQLSNYSAGDTGEWTFYDEFNGSGDLIGTASQSLTEFENSSDSRWLDGQFSAVLRMDTGSITVNPYAWAIYFGQSGYIYTGSVYPTAVTQAPEPTSLLLLAAGLGMIGLGARHRKR